MSPDDLRQVCDFLVKAAKPARETPRPVGLLTAIALASIVALVVGLVIAMSK
jgi:hypothetical protein